MECRGCDYYLPAPVQKGAAGIEQGQCRANPPTPIGFPVPVQTLEGNGIQLSVQSVWPVVAAAEWCGAHSSLDSDEPQPEHPEAPPAH